MAIIRGLGLLFCILLGFRLRLGNANHPKMGRNLKPDGFLCRCLGPEVYALAFSGPNQKLDTKHIDVNRRTHTCIHTHIYIHIYIYTYIYAPIFLGKRLYIHLSVCRMMSSWILGPNSLNPKP